MHSQVIKTKQYVKLTRLEMESAEAGLPCTASNPGILTCRTIINRIGITALCGI